MSDSTKQPRIMVAGHSCIDITPVFPDSYNHGLRLTGAMNFFVVMKYGLLKKMIKVFQHCIH